MYLIWSILNIVLFLYFLYLLVGYVSIGREVLPKNRFRPLVAILLIVGVFQIIKPSKEENKIVQRFKVNEYYNGNLSKTKRLADILLEDNLSFNITADLSLALTDDDNYLATEGTTSLIGFVSGFEWVLDDIIVNKFNPKEGGKYKVHGRLKWNLMGVNVYTEVKEFEGSFEVNAR